METSKMKTGNLSSGSIECTKTGLGWFVYQTDKGYYYNYKWNGSMGQYPYSYVDEEEAKKVFEKLTKKESKMENVKKFGVKVESPIISEAIQKIAFENNLDWRTNDKKVSCKESLYLHFDKTNGIITHSNTDCVECYSIVGIDECIRLLQEKPKPKIKDILIGSHKVEYTTSGDIRVGCKTFGIAEVNEVKKCLNSLNNIHGGIEFTALELRDVGEDTLFVLPGKRIEDIIKNWELLYGEG